MPNLDNGEKCVGPKSVPISILCKGYNIGAVCQELRQSGFAEIIVEQDLKKDYFTILYRPKDTD